jgi:membrane protein implicated in regulation of membrane protease activity
VWGRIIVTALALATGAVGLQAQAVAVGDQTLIWAMQVGGPLFALNVVVLVLYRRDVLKLYGESQGQTKTLMELVSANITAFRESTAESARVARALERLENRP